MASVHLAPNRVNKFWPFCRGTGDRSWWSSERLIPGSSYRQCPRSMVQSVGGGFFLPSAWGNTSGRIPGVGA